MVNDSFNCMPFHQNHMGPSQYEQLLKEKYENLNLIQNLEKTIETQKCEINELK